MPSEVSTVIGNQSLEELRRELTESREQQTATAEILSVISNSPTNAQRVFAAIATSAARLCAANDATIHKVDGGVLRLVGHHGPIPAESTLPPIRGILVGRAVLDRRTLHVGDLPAERTEYPEGSDSARRLGFRTVLGVPLIRAGQAIGAIAIRRTEARPFSDRQISLLKTFADQAVIAIENTRLFEEVQRKNDALTDANTQLTESLDQQTATGEILGVISRSPTDVQPVFGAIARSVVRLCNGEFAFVLRFDGEHLHFAASHGLTPEGLTAFQNALPRPAGEDTASGRAILHRDVVQIPDIQADPVYGVFGVAQAATYRSLLAAPLLRDGDPVGTIAVGRAHSGPFPESHIRLMRAFADQAVIAIENARLFEEVQQKNAALTASNTQLSETLEQQTATSMILRVISGSPTDVRPVFETVAENSVTLCHADRAIIYRFDGEFLRLAASYNASAELRDFIERNPIPPGRQSASGRAALERLTKHIPDLQEDAEYTYGWRRDVDPIRTALAVPMLKGGILLGVIFIYRFEVRPFTDKQISLVETFADQAVIAIENTRLFEEVQARNAELRVALEQQTATSELLKVIGRSTFDLKPVFEMLIESAVKLCGATRGFVSRFDGKVLRFAAGYNVTPELRHYFEQNPFAIDRHSNTGRAALERRTIHNVDVQADPEYTYGGSQVDPYRTVLAIPMLRADDLLGVILIYRHEVLPFTNSQIALIETFADQAVIAIENTRLLDEVQARNRDLTALGEVGRAVTSTLDFKVVLKTIVDRAVELSGTDGGSIFYYRNGRFELGETAGLDNAATERFRKLDILAGQTGLGEAIGKLEPLQLPDILNRPSNPLRDAALEIGFRAAVIVPLLSGDDPLGALVLQRRHPGEFPRSVVDLMQSFANQSAIALENARLFEEIAQKSRELEIASQHKSQFVANMSHELRTPLAAILGYAELMQEGFYEPLGQKSLDALTRIRSNGKHLLGLINTVLDIAKIESGQFTLNMAEYDIESVVETVRSATESLAQNKRLALKTEVSESLPTGLGDEQRLTQVLLNLVGNAIKFTDTGEVCVSAKAVNGHFNVSVTDTGPGIPVEHQARIFDQFHQVDSSNTKAKGGTGLGLAIAKQIVEMHGGRIWVESTLGKGSTFQMELPTRAATG